MKEILQSSDFALKISFADLSKKNLRVTKFHLAYNTALSSPAEAWFDGQNCSPNCRFDGDGFLVLFNAPKFNTGQLFVKRTYSIASTLFDDGTKDYTEIQALPLHITQSYSNTAIDCTAASRSASGDIVWFETVAVEALKGETGTSSTAIDYSSFAEQAIPNQFWVSSDGITTKQLYGRRLRLSAPVQFATWAPEATGYFAPFSSIQPMDTLFSITGSAYLSKGEHSDQTIIWGAGAWCQTVISSSDSSLCLFLKQLDAEFNKKTVVVDVFITYTKLT